MSVVDHNSEFSVQFDLYDGLHPNESGEEKMAEQWYQALLSFIDKPLPVELVQFSGRAERAGTRLHWVTASELNNASFRVARSATGTEFAPIGQVAGHSTTTNRHTYTFLDATAPSRPVLYYRLRQMDTDSTVHYSDVVVVRTARSTALAVSPVPAQDVLVVHGASERELITIWNMRGQLVYQQAAKSPPAPIQLSHLASGIYVVKAGAQHTRLVKQ